MRLIKKTNVFVVIHRSPLCDSTWPIATFVLKQGLCLPALVHSPQVHTGEGRGTLVPLAGVRRAAQGEPLHADLGNPVSRMAVHGDVATVDA